MEQIPKIMAIKTGEKAQLRVTFECGTEKSCMIAADCLHGLSFTCSKRQHFSTAFGLTREVMAFHGMMMLISVNMNSGRMAKSCRPKNPCKPMLAS
jgi:hypothetical protein